MGQCYQNSTKKLQHFYRIPEETSKYNKCQLIFKPHLTPGRYVVSCKALHIVLLIIYSHKLAFDWWLSVSSPKSNLRFKGVGPLFHQVFYILWEKSPPNNNNKQIYFWYTKLILKSQKDILAEALEIDVHHLQENLCDFACVCLHVCLCIPGCLFP